MKNMRQICGFSIRALLKHLQRTTSKMKLMMGEPEALQLLWLDVVCYVTLIILFGFFIKILFFSSTGTT
jgi:hypothetical protein